MVRDPGEQSVLSGEPAVFGKRSRFQEGFEEGLRQRGKALKLQLVVVAIIAAFFGLLIGIVTSPASDPEEVSLPAGDGGLLADTIGDDALWQVQVGQAAMKREVALLGRWVREGPEALPEDVEVALALAALESRYERLQALVSGLEAGQLRLRPYVSELADRLKVLAYRLSEQEQALEGLLSGKGN